MMSMLAIDPARFSGAVGKKLIALVGAYNKLSEEEPIRRLFYLQKISHLIYNTKNPEIINWRNEPGESGLEHHLQHYGVHRDASVVLQGIEFAHAIRRHSPFVIAPERSFYSAMKARDEAFTAEPSPEVLEAYVANNVAMMAHYDEDEGLKEKIVRRMHFLALSYAKVEAIQGLIRQHFDSYQTAMLSGNNNKNYLFHIDGEEEPLVIRVEDRLNLGDEWALQCDEVGKYFSEDYATVMVLIEGNGEAYYLPVIVSQFARNGDLEHYAKSFLGQKPEVMSQAVRDVFGQLTDFCIKLMGSGHYHPDIKLSNFLIDGQGHLIISDRKALINELTPQGYVLKSTPIFAPPEFMTSKKVHMPSYMAFQIGNALKEWMLKSHGIAYDGQHHEGPDAFSSRRPITPYLTHLGNEGQNISVLIQELTRPTAEDRLSIEHIQCLLAQIHLAPDAFMKKLGELSPQNQLSHHESIEFIKKRLNPELIKKVHAAELSDPMIAKELAPLFALAQFNALCRDPRLGLDEALANKLEQIQKYPSDQKRAEKRAKIANFAHALNQQFRVKHSNPSADLEQFLRAEPLKQVKEYVHRVTLALRTEDFQKASLWERLLQFIGWRDVPKRTGINDLKENLPLMDSVTKDCIKLSQAIHCTPFPGLNSEEQALLEVINAQHAEELSPSTLGMLEKMTSSDAPPKVHVLMPESNEPQSIDVMVRRGSKAIKEGSQQEEALKEGRGLSL